MRLLLLWEEVTVVLAALYSPHLFEQSSGAKVKGKTPHFITVGSSSTTTSCFFTTSTIPKPFSNLDLKNYVRAYVAEFYIACAWIHTVLVFG